MKEKELTIEQKAKRYDEAIIRAKSLIGDTIIEESGQHIAEVIFPELKENEGESIKEWLINLVKGHIEWLEDRIREQLSNGQVYGGELVKAKNSLAWLEKQGKNNMSISEATKQELEDNLNKALEKETPESCNEFLEKQGEQKTAENKDYSAPLDIEIPFGAKDSELIQETIRIPDGCYAFIEGNEIVIKKGEKPAWSEEDKAMVEDIIEAIDTQYAVTDYNEMVNWLKSLKDRVQPKVELTQLDKNILEAAIAFVEQNNLFNCWRGVDKHTVLSALHSLKPQNTWKPSDEQMQYLSWIANIKLGDGVVEQEVSKHLNELLEDLKKLREG